MVETSDPVVVLRALNRAWHDLDPEAIVPSLRPLFTADATVVGPRCTVMASGGDAAAASYADFARAAVVTDFHMDEPSVRRDGDTAVATYAWRIGYDLDATHYEESGHDIVVLRRAGEQWRIFWRAMLPDPDRSRG